ncbi:MAG: DNA repair protein [Pseudopedobacter saltans]|uniref:DNA repair protein n=1 Tax=Pseudopedobacter saltans TaxID=151895 RepID=A0A2W5FCY0_9SPHI|nr:MAG: DNA repair protein [Pseudopedobacter saltans]
METSNPTNNLSGNVTTTTNDWTLVQEVSISYKNTIPSSQRPLVCGSLQVADLLRHLWNSDEMEVRESFKLLLLNNANRVLGIYHASEGGTTGTIVDVRLLLTVALKANACKFIVAVHNHPSANLKPSSADIRLTTKLKDAAALLDITLLDHIILSTESYYSFADEGLL